MYLTENIIRSATRKQDDNLSIIVVNDAQSDYVERLALAFPNHNFYIVQQLTGQSQQWDRPISFENIKYYLYLDDLPIKYVDLVICFNRMNAFDGALHINHDYHVPMANIDMASRNLKHQIPLKANLNIEDPAVLDRRFGNVAVGSSDFITESWRATNQKLNATIDLPYKLINRKPDANKILIDKAIPQEFVGELGIHLDNRFTHDPAEAAVYCHLFMSPSCLMIDCMASEIPVFAFDSIDMSDYYQKELCYMVKEVNSVNSPTFLQEILAMEDRMKIAPRARDYVLKKNSHEQFKNKWENILRYLSNSFYQRGI